MDVRISRKAPKLQAMENWKTQIMFDVKILKHILFFYWTAGLLPGQFGTKFVVQETHEKFK